MLFKPLYDYQVFTFIQSLILYLLEEFFNSKVYHDIEKFKKKADVIVANRTSDELEDVMDKVYSRDIYSKN